MIQACVNTICPILRVTWFYKYPE